MVQLNQINSARLEIARINTEFYNGADSSRALAHYALMCLLSDTTVTEQELQEATAIGMPGDVTLDAWWKDDQNSRIILIQAKYTDSPDGKQPMPLHFVQALRSAVTGLTDENFIQTYTNRILREAYNTEIADLIYDESYSVYAVLAAGGQVSQKSGARAYCAGAGSDPWMIHDGNTSFEKAFKMEILDAVELQDEARRLRLSETPDFTLSVVKPESTLPHSFHLTGGRYRSAVATIHSKSLAEAYDKFRFRIFQHNPRGPQASNIINKEIVETVRDPVKKKMFHLLNNGITIVCDSFRFEEEEGQLQIRNLQIVNGCQTVYTLSRHMSDLTDEVQVNARIVEGLQASVKLIAKASNSQIAVKAEQLASLDSVHDSIREILDNNNPRWYYESQLGHVHFLSEAARRVHRTRYGANSVSIGELGKSAVAFLGYPITAKHDAKALFEQREPVANLYDTIFSADNSADQLLLPVSINRAVKQAIKDRLKQLRADQSESPSGADELNWLSSAQFHAVALIGFSLSHSSTGQLLSQATSSHFLSTLHDWFPARFEQARSAIHFSIRVANRAEGVFNIRKFYRDESIYAEMKGEMQ